MNKIKKWIKENLTFNAFKYVMKLIWLSLKLPIPKLLYPILIYVSIVAIKGNVDMNLGIPFLSVIIFIYVITLVDANLKNKK